MSDVCIICGPYFVGTCTHGKSKDVSITLTRDENNALLRTMIDVYKKNVDLEQENEKLKHKLKEFDFIDGIGSDDNDKVFAISTVFGMFSPEKTNSTGKNVERGES